MARDQNAHTAAPTKVNEGQRASQLIPTRRGEFARSEWMVAFVVLAFYRLLILRALVPGGDPRDFVLIGSKFINRPGPSAVIKPDPTYHYTLTGYDGQFCYYIAWTPSMPATIVTTRPIATRASSTPSRPGCWRWASPT